MTVAEIIIAALATPEVRLALREALGIERAIADDRIPLPDVRAHGAPSPEWVRDRARRGKIQIHGPRGGRYVLRAELETLLAASTIARRTKPTPLADDAKSAVVDLAARRTKRTG